MWVEYNPNPVARRVGDCAVRAVSKALDVDWETAYCLLVKKGFLLGDMPSSNAIWGAVLRDHGFSRAALPDSCPDCYTVEDFAEDHPKGTYVLGLSGHTVAIRDGNIYDSWDSSGEPVQYYWYRKE